jgi:phosphatidylserine decarboxylase
VSPKIARLVRGLFNLNERAVYVGTWRHGFFSFAAIGATNVGSIRIYIDEDLKTNIWKNRKGTQFEYKFPKPLDVRKGDPFGEFNLGSTVVLIFEAPSDLEFAVKPGDRILVGKPFLKEGKAIKDKSRNESKL